MNDTLTTIAMIAAGWIVASLIGAALWISCGAGDHRVEEDEE